MRVYQTDFQKAHAHVPSQLELETTAYNRGLITSKKDIAAYRRNLAGYKGERTIIEYLEKYGKNHWIAIPNLWMDYYGLFEIDLALFTSHKVYTLEIKNYFGDFVFKNGISYLNDIQLTTNPLFQARRAQSNLQEIFRRKNMNIPVEGSLIFAGIDNYVEIQTEITDLNLVIRTELLHFIKNIIKEEENYKGKPIDWYKTIPQLGDYEVSNPFFSKPYTANDLQKVQKGILCRSCQQYNVQIGKQYVTCNCGYVELREEAIVRTLHELATLIFDRDFTSREALTFLDYQVSKSNLVKILNKYFIRNFSNRYARYQVNSFPSFDNQFTVRI